MRDRRLGNGVYTKETVRFSFKDLNKRMANPPSFLNSSQEHYETSWERMLAKCTSTMGFSMMRTRRRKRRMKDKKARQVAGRGSGMFCSEWHEC